MTKIKFSLGILAILTICSCQKPVNLSEGHWRAVLTPDTSRSDLALPFNIKFLLNDPEDWTATITNADEKILITEILETEDSVNINLPVFEGYIKTRKTPDGLVGEFTHKAAGRSWSAPIIIKPGETKRFDLDDEKALFDPSGKWEVTVNPDSDNPETQVGEFIFDGKKLTGTFLTVIGDYRFLEGNVSGDQFRLSCFDGAHSLLFTARLTQNGTLLDGVFTGGPTWNGTWTAKKNKDIQLPDATSLTYLKPGYPNLEFSFPDTNGKITSLDDEKYNDKAKIVQIIGSWCPNCMDETRFFSELQQISRPGSRNHCSLL